jgi:WXG100 family type VII secretion target
MRVICDLDWPNQLSARTHLCEIRTPGGRQMCRGSTWGQNVVDEIAVDFRALEDGEASLRRAVDEIQVHLEELERCVQELLSTWTGQAAEAYREAQHEWDAAMAGMRENLRELHGLIVTAHGNHASAVRTNNNIWAM